MSLWSFIGRRAARIATAYEMEWWRLHATEDVRPQYGAALGAVARGHSVEPYLRWPDEKIPVHAVGEPAERATFSHRNLWTGDKIDPDQPGAFSHPIEQAAEARDPAGTVPPSDEGAGPMDGERAAPDVANHHGGEDEVADRDTSKSQEWEAGEGVALPDDPASHDDLDVGIHPAPPKAEHPLVVAMRRRFGSDDILVDLFADNLYEAIADALAMRIDALHTSLDSADRENKQWQEQAGQAAVRAEKLEDALAVAKRELAQERQQRPAAVIFPDDVRALLDTMIADTGRSENDLIVGMVGDILRDDAAAHEDEDEDEDDERDDRARRDLDAAGIEIRGTVPVSPPLDGEITPPPQPIDLDKRNQRIIDMARNGIAPKAIAEHLGMSAVNVSLILSAARKRGVDVPRFGTSGQVKRTAPPRDAAE